MKEEGTARTNRVTLGFVEHIQKCLRLQVLQALLEFKLISSHGHPFSLGLIFTL